jgi:uncharacterized membrane protein
MFRMRRCGDLERVDRSPRDADGRDVSDVMPRRRTDLLARGLGIFSLALGLAQVAAPTAVARAIGLRGEGTTRVVMRALGVREILSGVGLLSQRRPTPWLWSRVAGDAVDLGLLGAAMAAVSNGSRRRLGAAAGMVTAVAVVDIAQSARHTASRAPDENGMEALTSITVRQSPDEAYAYWRDLANLPRFMAHLESVTETGGRRSHWVAAAPGRRTVEWDAQIEQDEPGRLITWRSREDADVPNEGEVRFAPAPGDRGTEVHVRLRYHPPAGALGDTVAKLLGESPIQQIKDDLRRFKQIVETGQVIRSDGSPEGTHVTAQIPTRPAQPLPSEEAA